MASMHGYPRSAFFRCGLGMEGVKNSFSVKSYGKYEIGGMNISETGAWSYRGGRQNFENFHTCNF